MGSLTAEPLAQNDSVATGEHQQTAAINKQPRIKALAAELFACSNSSPKKLSKVIDVALRADVIALANSYIFSFGRPVRSLVQAIACLGYDRCRNLVATRLGIESTEEMQAEQAERPKSETEAPRRLPGVRPYRKERLSSLYPPRNRGQRPLFLSAGQGWT